MMNINMAFDIIDPVNAIILVSFINEIAKSYDNGKQTDVIFMDIAKVFDTATCYNRLRHNSYSGMVSCWQYLPMYLILSK